MRKNDVWSNTIRESAQLSIVITKYSIHHLPWFMPDTLKMHGTYTPVSPFDFDKYCTHTLLPLSDTHDQPALACSDRALAL